LISAGLLWGQPYFEWRLFMMRVITTALLLSVVSIAGHAHAQSNCTNTTVYFELGSSTLTRAGADTLDAVAAYVGGGRIVVDIAGHSDAAEAGGLANLDLQRAAAVAAGLAANPRGADWTYRLSGLDATKPAEPTPPNVSEPLNRRAEISVCKAVT
jgi:outer membrane protein OmpA-like peptidoglycan-associated protein